MTKSILAGAVKEVDAVQFALAAGGDRDATCVDVQIVGEEGFQCLDDDRAVLGVRLNSTMGRT